MVLFRQWLAVCCSSQAGHEEKPFECSTPHNRPSVVSVVFRLRMTMLNKTANAGKAKSVAHKSQQLMGLLITSPRLLDN